MPQVEIDEAIQKLEEIEAQLSSQLTIAGELGDLLQAIKDKATPPPPPADMILLKPNSRNEINLRAGDLKPGQIAAIDADTLTNFTIDDLSGTADKPITIKTLRPVTLPAGKFTYWKNINHLVLDMRQDNKPGFFFRGRFFVRGQSSHITLRGFHSTANLPAWTIAPPDSGETMSHIRIEDCSWVNVENGEGIYLGDNQADPRKRQYLMNDITIRNCRFERCAEPFHLAGVVGFIVEGNTMIDTLTTRPPAHNAAISIARWTHTGIIRNNTIKRVRGNGINLLSGPGEVVITGNHIEAAGLGAGDDALKKNIYGLRLQTGSADKVTISGNTFKDIDTAAIAVSGHFGSADKAWREIVVKGNTFENCKVEVE